MSLLVTIPHSGEKIPPQTPWLAELPEPILMCDVDRYVDVLYEPTLAKLNIPFVKTEWHRYAADLNRVPTDVNASSVAGHPDASPKFNRGFHWVNTTYKHQLMKSPMPKEDHEALVKLVFDPFHTAIRSTYCKIRDEQQKQQATRKKSSIFVSAPSSSSYLPPIFHIDAHSMPSVGTTEHLDANERRADVVVSDCKGKSCDSGFRDLVIVAYTIAGFKVGFNWPYFGGRLTQFYGKPQHTRGGGASSSDSTSTKPNGDQCEYPPMLNQHVIQVEMNRSLYMNETTKQLDAAKAEAVKIKLDKALQYILERLPALEEQIIRKQGGSKL